METTGAKLLEQLRGMVPDKLAYVQRAVGEVGQLGDELSTLKAIGKRLETYRDCPRSVPACVDAFIRASHNVPCADVFAWAPDPRRWTCGGTIERGGLKLDGLKIDLPDGAKVVVEIRPVG